ncbi:hypothetical protein WH47_01804, partial [Habropoda laboriosa]
ARRVMWRQADNPLAPSDKYEARRAFSAFSQYYTHLSVERAEKQRTKGRLPFPPAVSHSVNKLELRLTDPPS